MKKTLCICAALVLLLSGCGGKEPPAVQAYEPAATAQALLDSGAFTQELEALDADMVSAHYALDDEPQAAAVYTSLEGGYEELTVLTMADETAAAAALKALESYIDTAKETEADVQYKPKDLPKLENARLEQAGESVLLVVAADYDKVQAALDGLSA